jgi:shikimate dehydrogenase
MHNRVFEKLGLDYCYLPVEVGPEHLRTVFAGLRRMNVAGFNVTIPHKIAIMACLDELDPLAATIGAVNTICLRHGRAIGYNTDGEGFVRSLEEEAGLSVRGKRVCILGCGGAVRAIAMTLAFRGAERIVICNRTLAKAQELAAEINGRIRPCAEAVEQVFERQAEALSRSDILVNGTSIGMHPRPDELPIAESLLARHLVVADIVYNPLTTRLLSTAEQNGCRIVRGLGMLVYQGAAAFTLWTGLEPLVDEMKETACRLMKQD